MGGGDLGNALVGEKEGLPHAGQAQPPPGAGVLTEWGVHRQVPRCVLFALPTGSCPHLRVSQASVSRARRRQARHQGGVMA